jgi:HEAT repeat protein
MGRKNSVGFESTSYNARACALARRQARSSIFLQIILISLSFFMPAYAASPFEAAVTELQSADLKTQYDGLEKIKAFHTPEATQALVKSALAKADINFRLAVLDQIGALQNQTIVPSLAPLLADKNAAIRQRAAQVIGIINGPFAEAVLLPAVVKETNPGVKATLIHSLGLCGSQKSVATLKIAASDSDPAIRANAAYAHKRITGHEVK